MFSRRGNAQDAWAAAASELAIELVTSESELGPIARGRVNAHEVSVTPVNGKGRKKATLYGVTFHRNEAPAFRMIKRGTHEMPVVDTGHADFDQQVVVQTSEPEALGTFLTSPRRAAIMRIFEHWPKALISNSDLRITTEGLESDASVIVDAVCHLVATAETFDRTGPSTSASVPEAIEQAELAEQEAATPPVQAPQVQAPQVQAPAVRAPAPVPEPQYTAPVAASAEVATQVRLDEVSLFADLFGRSLTDDQIAHRFEQLYRGHDVRWTGEIVRIGSPDHRGRQRIAALVGSANGQSAASGRVVAMASIDPTPIRRPGEVIAIAGSLINLDVAQRMFHIA